MSDSLWVLRHPTNKLTKTWNADGTISAYDDPKYFNGTEIIVRDLRSLSTALTRLESDAHACVIRGKYKGYDYSLQEEPEETIKGKVLRRKSVHEDCPRYYLCVDIDGYKPIDYDPLLEPVDAIREFIRLCLPKCFHDISFHYQLSSSAGHPSKGLDTLKAHVWFWLKTPYTSAQLRAWGIETNFKGDKSLFDTIQVHYTAAPVFEKGVVNPISKRSGMYEGEWGDTVHFEIPDDILAKAGDGSAAVSRSTKLREVQSGDPVVTMLTEKGMVLRKRPDGGLNITCPRESEHSGKSGESSTMYYPAHTGGYVKGTFVCLHDHCRSVPQSLFLSALGYDDTADVFDALPDDEKEDRTVPESKHLCTDQANANRFVNAFGQKVMVVADRWYAYQGTHWAPDEGDAMIKAMNLSRLIETEADAWEHKKVRSFDEREKNKVIADSLRVWSKKSEMAGTINAAMALAKKVLARDTADVDRDHFLLSVRNGTVDLRTGKLRPHDAKDYITKHVDIDFNPDAECPTWQHVLECVTLEHGKEYTPLSDFLQVLFGYAFTGSTREQIFAVMYGKGSNGKSTIVDTLMHVMGPYAGTGAPGLLVSSDRSRHPTEIADLFGRRLVVVHETGEGNVLREDFVKQATGGDMLKARWMNKDFFEFKPTHKFFMLTNHKPVIRGQDDGIWRRILLIPFVAKFGTEAEVKSGLANFVKDLRMTEKLMSEVEGILAWLVRGAAKWYRDGLNPPDIVLAASHGYRIEQDRVQQFLDEVCTIGIELTCYLTNGEFGGIYAAYSRWCKMSGIHPLSKINFLNHIERIVPGFRQTTALIGIEGGARRKVTVLHGISCPEAFEL